MKGSGDDEDGDHDDSADDNADEIECTWVLISTMYIVYSFLEGWPCELQCSVVCCGLTHNEACEFCCMISSSFIIEVPKASFYSKPFGRASTSIAQRLRCFEGIRELKRQERRTHAQFGAIQTVNSKQ